VLSACLVSMVVKQMHLADFISPPGILLNFALNQKPKIENMVNLLGIPFDANSSYLRGPAQAPARIRQMDAEGSANRFAENGMEIIPGISYHDLGDLSFTSDDPAYAFQFIRSGVKKHLSSGHPLLCIGGDHSISYPVIDAHTEVYNDLHVLHFDAHTDLYEQGKIQSLQQVGIRTLTTHQREQAKRYGVNILEMKDLHFDFLQQLPSPLYISLDVDVLDPAYAPGVSHHEPGGMSTRQLLHMLQQVKANVVGADLVEYNPSRDINNMTAMVGYKLMKELVVLMLP
jgi:arginase